MLRLHPVRSLFAGAAVLAASLAIPVASDAVASGPSYDGLMWGTSLASNAPLDTNSGPIVKTLVSLVNSTTAAGNPPWISISKCSMPIFTVPGTQPTVNVQLSNPTAPSRTALAAAFAKVPLPSTAFASNCSDKEAVVVQPSKDRMWDFWHLTSDSTGWHADWGGATKHASTNVGSYGPNDWLNATFNWGSTASSLTLAGAVIQISEFQAGVIPHALGLLLPDVRAAQWAFPAQRSDGTLTGSNTIPYGARFRLPASLNIDAMSIPAATKILAHAAQDYGIIPYDRSGSGITFTAEAPTPGQPNPWQGLLGGTPGQVLASFPWSKLKLLKMDLRTTQGP